MFLTLMRIGACLCLAILFTAMLGPFQGAEEGVGLNDKSAHVIGFAVITACLTVLAPRLGLVRTAILAVALGGGVELIQGLTGRSANPLDFAADAVGVAIASLARGFVDKVRPQLLSRN